MVPSSWITTTIGEAAKLGSGSTPSRSKQSDYFDGGTIPWVKTGDLNNELVQHTEECITRQALDESSCKIYPVGTLLVAMYGGFKQIGRTGLLGCDAAINQALTAISLDQQIACPAYVQQWLNCRVDHWKRLAGSSRKDPNITKSEVAAFPLLLPPANEQQAIVCILSTWDRGIRQLTDLIAAKVRFKQGLMQQLLTGQRRFKDFETRDLRTCELQDFLTITARPIDRPTKAYKALGLRSHGKGTFVRFVEDPEQVQMDTLYQVKKDDLIVNITFAWEGAIAIVSEEDEEALVSHRFPTFVFDHSKALPEYLRQVVITPWFIFKMGLVSPGGAGRNRVLNKKDFLKIEIPLPEIDEQSRIASFLGEADREIALLQKSLDSLKQQKKGLMQKLLTGEVRVKI
jgi:type I restriction enzyme S subunit